MVTVGYLLDTNVLGRVSRVRSNCGNDADRAVANRFNQIKDFAQFFICSLTIGECEYGLKVAPTKSDVRQMAMREILAAFPIVLPVDEHVARGCYSDLRASLFRKYAPKDAKGRAKSNFVEEWLDPTTGRKLGVDEHDVWLAAVAMHYNFILVSNDSMERISEVCGSTLRIEDWTH